jgi:hypothetical protein
VQPGLGSYPRVTPAARREQDNCGALPGLVLSLIDTLSDLLGCVSR